MDKIKNLINSLEKCMEQKGPMIKGSLYEVRKKCSYKNCKKCKSGELHHAIQFTFTDKNLGRSTTSVKKEFYKDVKIAWDEYKKINDLEIKFKNELNKFFDRLKTSKQRRLIPVRDYIFTLKKRCEK